MNYLRQILSSLREVKFSTIGVMRSGLWVAGFMFTVLPQQTWAQTASQSTSQSQSQLNKLDDSLDEKKLSYPELEVTPRATKRLEIETNNERSQKWIAHLPIQTSALATYFVGTNSDAKQGLGAQDADNFSKAQDMAVAIGTGWLVGTVVLSAAYLPYRAGFKQVKPLGKKTMRDELTRERIAEEALARPAGLATKLKWASVVTNFYASASLIENADDTTRKTAMLATAFAFMPLLFEPHWSDVYNQHREYKKKIYGPVSYMAPVQIEKNWIPTWNLRWEY